MRAQRFHRTLLVVGHRAEEVLQAVRSQGIEAVYNPRYREGLSTSLQAGFGALQGEEGGVLVVLGDQPQVRGDTLRRLLNAYNANRPLAVVPTHRGRKGNPVVLDLRMRQAVENLRGDVGCRVLLRTTRTVRTLEVDDPGILLDVDTREDLARARESLAREVESDHA